jgi:diguanylate cyclase (GGDEF)-like protein/PAS domain S-box-containing protein
LAASVFTHSREGIIITSSENKILDVNYAVERITGYTKEELLGHNPKILSSGQHSEEFYKKMWQELQMQGFWNGEIWNRRKEGDVYAQMMTITAVKDSNNDIIRYVALFSDITPLKEHQKRLEYIAHYDALSGLPNRVLLSDRLHLAMAQTHRNKSTLAVVYLDLDGFKEVNDTYGHDNGDKLLSVIAERMKNSLREGDTIARLGGDEFVAVLLDLNTHEDCLPMLKRLLHAASETVNYNDLIMKVTASLGVCFFDSGDTIDADQLLRYADQAMYQAKLLGKNRFQVFDTAQDASIRTYHEKLEKIQNALINQEFLLYYQPKVNMATGEVIGVEALIRWSHPLRGLLAPGEFLPIIEGNTLSIKVGEWVLEAAFKQIEYWKAAGLRFIVSINVDAIHILKGNIVEHIESLLKKYPSVASADFRLEILETSALEDITRVIEIMQDCKKIGVTFALDDFGTGYSSLTYLKRLPVSELKIDQSFVRDMLHDIDDLAILDGVIGLANAFHRDVVAEGVESISQGKILLRMGCTIAQGYAIARPMPAENIMKWIAEYKTDASWLGLVPVSRDNMPVLYALVEHSAWMKEIIEYIQGQHSLTPEQNHHECRFGQWLEGIGKKYYGEDSRFYSIKEFHQEMHQRANFIIQNKDNQLYNFEEKMEELQEIHKRMIDILEDF